MMAKELVIDAKQAVLGRVATMVTKELLKGNHVTLINCEEIIVSGERKNFANRVLQKRKMGSGSSLKGPKYIRQADRLVKRMIRGMLPWDKAKGRDAYKRLKCYVTTETLSEEQTKNVITLDHQKPSHYTTIKRIVETIK